MSKTIQDIIIKHQQGFNVTEDLCLHFMYLVKHIVRRYIRYNKNIKDDLYSAGLEGLTIAAVKCQKQPFDNQVKKYFAIYIKGSIIKYLKDNKPYLEISSEKINWSVCFDYHLCMIEVSELLSETEFKIFQLKSQNYTLVEIAMILNLPYSTIAILFSQVKKKLKAYYLKEV